MAKHSDLRRRRPFREAKPLVVLFCEGEKTEPAYFTKINQFWGNKIVLEFPSCGTNPKGIVEAAVELKRRSKRLSRVDVNEEVQAIWCIFDRDGHLMVPEALQQADDNGIPVAFSDPCFELWLLLHFQDQTAHLERHQAQRLCANHMVEYEKDPDMKLLLPRVPEAERRAEALRARQLLNGLNRSNPWTDVHMLLAILRSLSGSPTITC